MLWTYDESIILRPTEPRKHEKLECHNKETVQTALNCQTVSTNNCNYWKRQEESL